MKKHNIISILCSICIVCTSCRNPFLPEEEDSSSLQIFNPETIYAEIYFTLPEDMAVNRGLPENIAGEDLRNFTVDENGIYAVYQTKDGMDAAAVYDWDGEVQTAFPLPETELQNISWFYPLEDGRLLTLANLRDSADSLFTDRAVILFDRDSSILYQYTFPDEVSYQSAFAVSEDCIAMVSAETLYLFDRTLQLQSEVSLALSLSTWYTNPIGWIDADTLYLHGDDRKLYSLDIHTGYLAPFCPGLEPVSTGAVWQYYSTDERFILWEVTSDGIYGIPHPGSESEEPVLICSWDASVFPKDSIQVCHIRDAENILCTSTNNINSELVHVLLHPRKTDPEAPVKETVTIAAFQDQNLAFLQKLVSLFNAQSETYAVELLQYENSMIPASLEDVSEELFRTLAEGNIPDLLLINNYGEALYRNLEKQGYLADVTALTDGLTASAKNAARYKGTFTRIPLTIRYSTLLSDSVETPLTLENILTDSDTLQPGQALFSAHISGDLTAVIQSLFIDTAALSCSFDSPEFISYLELLQDLTAFTDTGMGTLQTIEVNGRLTYRMTNSGLPDTLRRGDLRYLHLPLSSVSSWILAKLSYEDVLHVCGYPGALAIPVLNCSFVQFKDCENPDGAAAFVEYILSDTVQTSHTVTEFSFPVTSSAVEKILEPDWYTVTCSDVPIADPDREDMSFGTVLYVNSISYEKPQTPGTPEIRLIEYTDEDKVLLRSILEGENTGTVPDPTVEAILQEELSVYLSGDRSAADTARILQNRIGTYLAE